jgi:hypothetical protein
MDKLMIEHGKLKLILKLRSTIAFPQKKKGVRLPIFDLPVSVYTSQSHLQLEAREDGRERHGQTDD